MLAVIVYGISTIYSVFLWRRGFRQDNRINYMLLGLGFLFHTMAMVKRGFSLSRCPVNNIYEAITFVAWTIVAAYLVLGVWSRLRFLGAFASPVLFSIGVFGLMPALDTAYKDQPRFENGWTSLHAALFLLSYGAFGLSSVAALMYLTLEHDLKVHKLRAVFSLMPSMQRLELVVGRLLTGGFVLLTAGLAVSAYYLKKTHGVYFTGDSQILWSIFVWLLYLGLLLMRWRFAQGGRRFAWGAVGSFAFVLLTFWGIYLLSAVHQQ
jgi:ABC-type transport system involved in cytochrome c biogenesis permease subunit